MFNEQWTDLNRSAKSKIRQKHRLWKLYLQTNNINVYNKYRKINNQITLSTRQSIKYVEKNICDDAENNPKRFWKYANNKRKINVSILQLYKANTNKKKSILGSWLWQSWNIGNLVTFLLLKEKIHGIHGPDLVSAKILKELAEPIVPVLSIIFKTSYETVRLPSKWKEVNISSAIYKKGEKHDPENYSSISLTSIISKIMELII